ncbi:TetR family transcriptional regulator [Nocardioides sp. NPDC006303]|uniref:TetR/AcrR family transcriptional regulator n=1 Tax=Nocardioides sp. NPDC006303 TaxID=3156747 RepID=UPI0033A11E3C
MPHVPLRERQKKFVDAAIRVIAAEGVAKATTRRIAEVAEMPAASLHYCFHTKEELFQAVFEQALSEGPTKAGRDVIPGMGLRDGAAAVLRGYLDWMLLDRDLQQAQYELIFWALRNPDSRHLARQTYRSYIDATVELLSQARVPDEAGIDLEMLARQILATLDGHAMQWIALDDDRMAAVIENAIVEVRAVLPPLRKEA